MPNPVVSAEALAPFVEMAIRAIQQEYPYHYSIVLMRDQDLALPRVATPVFRGAFDWHSAVHGHWTLVRALRTCPQAAWAPRARAVLAMQLVPQRLDAEIAFLRAPGNEGFERPYGLAWLLQLCAELRGWDDGAGAPWSAAFAQLETIAASRLMAWLGKLPHPVRSGEHSQSAFAIGLFFDWALAVGNSDLVPRIAERAIRLYGADRDAPVAYEPSAHDFLSPLLGEADVLRRAMPHESFGPWLSRFLPGPSAPELSRWLVPAVSPDAADGKLAHLDGLNLSRAWMLDGIASVLDVGHAHRAPLLAAAQSHHEAGLAGAMSPHYAGSHWLGSFAVYALTRRGIAAQA